MVKKIYAKSKDDCSHLLGKFLDESHYDTLIEEDCDIYAPIDCDLTLKSACNQDCGSCPANDGQEEQKIIAKFRKNWFSKQEQDDAYVGLRQAAVESQNRGIAAGPRYDGALTRDWVTPLQLEILDYFLNPVDPLTGEDPIDAIKEKYKRPGAEQDILGQVWKVDQLRKDNFEWESWVEETRKLPQEQMRKRADRVVNYISTTRYANPVNSGIAGWFDRYPRIPFIRTTSYTRDNPELFAKSFPFLQTLDKAFKELMPWRWSNQRRAADSVDPAFLVPGTVFTTLTVNKTFRTAAHYDAGDLWTGLSNLLVLSNDGNYTGGYLVAPEYRVAINVRPGDLLLINNHEVMHGNTPIVLGSETSERVSLVCYFREKIQLGGCKEYEDLRAEFVEARRKNEKHPLFRKLWNGISPNCFSDNDGDQDFSAAKDWYEFLKGKPRGEEFLETYHPWLKNSFEGNTLESFFE